MTIGYWPFFEDQLEASHSFASNILNMLEAIQDYAHYTKCLPPACLTYIESMLPSWNGNTGREIVLDMLIYIPMVSFEELYHSFFSPVEDAILDDTIESKLVIFTFYNNLLRRWGKKLIASNHPSMQESTSVTSLIAHVNNLALTILQSSTSVTICSTVLTFYESIAYLISHTDCRAAVRIITPPAEVVYTMYFTSSLSTLTRLCSILTLYKRAFELATSSKASVNNQLSYPKEYYNHFNGFLMDICNCIWRSRAFNTSDANAVGCLLPVEITSTLTKYVSALDTSVSLAGLFSLSYSPVLCQEAISYVREREDNEDTIDVRHAGPVTQGSLKQLEMDGGLVLSWADYRLGVLRHLESNGVAGIGELMYNTMKHLMMARENMA